ncbi:hypothetical protein Slin15195_G130260 [Septoria linicola]|uniref:Uncharacterized protein n=1 Tax=Septoria linicola TaxID=215465 RepID=A0A9Q9B0Y4_9PEZI|nr:hypothetical protein Slin14017_G122160 [Septoria linicola]USW59707.1 hypothetical protein Slin15195_G130260 [Septoria linicola]
MPQEPRQSSFIGKSYRINKHVSPWQKIWQWSRQKLTAPLLSFCNVIWTWCGHGASYFARLIYRASPSKQFFRQHKRSIIIPILLLALSIAVAVAIAIVAQRSSRSPEPADYEEVVTINAIHGETLIREYVTVFRTSAVANDT